MTETSGVVRKAGMKSAKVKQKLHLCIGSHGVSKHPRTNKGGRESQRVKASLHNSLQQ